MRRLQDELERLVRDAVALDDAGVGLRGCRGRSRGRVRGRGRGRVEVRAWVRARVKSEGSAQG